jgi:TolB-like protein
LHELFRAIRGAHKSIDQIGRELHVDYVLDGTSVSVNAESFVSLLN